MLHIDSSHNQFTGCVCSDAALLNALIALKIFGFLDWHKLHEIETYIPYVMIGYVMHIEENYGGRMPTEWEALVVISHVKRKIASLLMQDGVQATVVKHLVADVHMLNVMMLNKWVPEEMIKAREVDPMAQYFEKWFLSYKQKDRICDKGRCFTPIGLRKVNEIYGCIRQH